MYFVVAAAKGEGRKSGKGKGGKREGEKGKGGKREGEKGKGEEKELQALPKLANLMVWLSFFSLFGLAEVMGQAVAYISVNPGLAESNQTVKQCSRIEYLTPLHCFKFCRSSSPLLPY